MPLSLLFFFVSITGIFLNDIFATYNIGRLSFFLTLILSFFLFLSAKVEKKKIYIPIKETIFYLLFIIFSVISTFLAIEKEVAFESLLLYGAGYLFFLFSFNYQEEIKKAIKPFLVSLSMLAILAFSINGLFKLSFFKESSSLFYAYDHNQIGNFLVLGLVSVFPSLLFLLFFVFILFSYSRTAYLSLILIFILQLLKNKLNKKAALIGGLIILVSLIFTVLTTCNLYLTRKKQLVGGRNIYFSYALSSIKEKPWFGVGPGNFYYAASKRQVNYGEGTTTAHNIIFNVLAENGVLAGIFFILFILLIIYRRKKDINFLLFLALSLMFMFDFSYRYNIFLVLWFILGGLVLDSKEKAEINMVIPALIVFIGAQVIIFGQILLNQGLWRQSLIIYPLQKKAYETAIEESIKLKNKQQAYYFLQKYDQLFGRSFQTIFKEIDYYQVLEDKNKIAALYEQAILLRPFVDVRMMKQMRDFYIELYGSSKANEQMAVILRQIKDSYLKQDRTSDLYRQINSFCLKADLGC